MKKTLKNPTKIAKKVLTKQFISGILCKLPQGEEKSGKKGFQKISKKSKKTLDKRNSTSYTNQAVTAKVAAREESQKEKILKKKKFFLTNSKKCDTINKLSPERETVNVP